MSNLKKDCKLDRHKSFYIKITLQCASLVFLHLKTKLVASVRAVNRGLIIDLHPRGTVYLILIALQIVLLCQAFSNGNKMGNTDCALQCKSNALQIFALAWCFQISLIGKGFHVMVGMQLLTCVFAFLPSLCWVKQSKGSYFL